MALLFNGKISTTNFGLTPGRYNPYIRSIVRKGRILSKYSLQVALLKLATYQHGYSEISYMEKLEAINCITQLLATFDPNPYFGELHALDDIIKVEVIVEAGLSGYPIQKLFDMCNRKKNAKVAVDSFFQTHDRNNYNDDELAEWIKDNGNQSNDVFNAISKTQNRLCANHDKTQMVSLTYEIPK